MRFSLCFVLLLACAQASFGQLQDSLRGTLGPGVFTVVGNIWVNADTVLQLAPGTTFNFQGAYYFRIYGRLIAEGTEESLIVFTTDQSGNNRWRGIRFDGAASSGSRLAYCLIEKGYARGTGSIDADGGGVSCFRGAPTFTHCTIRSCRASKGGGVKISHEISYNTEASPSFTECAFVGDSALSLGGGVECQDSASFTNCRFDSNVAEYGGGGADVTSLTGGYPSFTGCTFTANVSARGAGAWSEGSTTLARCSFSRNQATGTGSYGGGACGTGRFSDCVFSGNSAFQAGGGVSCGSSSTFINCMVSGNSTSYDGGGVSCSGSPVFTNCTISGNSAPRWGGGVYCGDNSSVAFNSTIISFSTGTGLYFSTNNSASHFAYCDIFGNSGGNIANPAWGPPGIGQLAMTNANGDPCDIYRNIFLDPVFVDTAASNFHLSQFSYCIGAGDTTDTVSTDFDGNPRPDPPESVPDIGASENPRASPIELRVTDLAISIQNGNAVLSWSRTTAGNYNIYGADAPSSAGTFLSSTADTTWADPAFAIRPSRYFYYLRAVAP